ncbi:MAG TPA: hypothetical protein VJY42_05075 [Candidatus Methanomethylophilaceae archaeon]|nr:hypothetical protein [Candidatus Methanomethylophilaceae archaeon]
MFSNKILVSMMAMMVLCTGASLLLDAYASEADDGIFEEDIEPENTDENEQNITILDDNTGLVVGSLVILACLVMFVLFIARMILWE